MRPSWGEKYPVIPYDPEAVNIEEPWMIYNWIKTGGINAIFGPEKHGKSRVLHWIMAMMWANQPHIFNVPILDKPSKVLYLAGEETASTVFRRIADYSTLLGEEPLTQYPMDLIEAPSMRLDLSHERAELEDLLLRDSYDCLVIEPFRRVHGGDENSNTGMSVICNELRKWSNVHGVTVIFSHHTGHLRDDADIDRIATWSRGATDLAAIVDTACFVYRFAPTMVKIRRAGRFPPVDPLVIEDKSDPDRVEKKEGEHVFELLGT